jgi:hypothetical protein
MSFEYNQPVIIDGGSGIVIGGAVGGSPIPNAVLYVDASSNAGNNANFKWDSGVIIAAPATTNIPLQLNVSSGHSVDILKTTINSVQTATINAAGEFTHPRGVGSSNEAFGSGCLNNTVTGGFNTAVGFNVLRNATSGIQNVGVGYLALRLNESGLDNVAVGKQAVYSCVSGSTNVAVGTGALQGNVTGSQNVAVGTNALKSGTGISTNTALGHEAGFTTIGTRNVFIGYKAGYFESASNQLYIDSSNTNTPLIGGDFSLDEVYINGDLAVVGVVEITTTLSDALKLTSTGTAARAGCQFINDTATSFQFFIGGSLHGVYPDKAALVLDDGVPFVVAHTSSTPRLTVDEDGNVLVGTNTKPSANSGQMLIFRPKSSDPTMGTDTCGLYGKSDGGNLRMHAIDEDGTKKYLTLPHQLISQMQFKLMHLILMEYHEAQRLPTQMMILL